MSLLGKALFVVAIVSVIRYGIWCMGPSDSSGDDDGGSKKLASKEKKAPKLGDSEDRHRLPSYHATDQHMSNLKGNLSLNDSVAEGPCHDDYLTTRTFTAPSAPPTAIATVPRPHPPPPAAAPPRRSPPAARARPRLPPSSPPALLPPARSFSDSSGRYSEQNGEVAVSIPS